MAPLLGPPEIHHPSSTAAATATATGDPFMDVMTAQFNATLSTLRAPARGYTKNDSPTFVSTGHPCLDFFYHILPDTPPHTLHQKLQSAWEHDPLTALKLVCHLRAVRGAGKADKESFYTAALWLHAHHPRTLALNINHISSFGYLKDMPELLFRLHTGNDARQLAREERLARLRRKKKLRKQRKRELKSLDRKSVVQKILSWDPNDSGHVSPEMARELRKKKATDMRGGRWRVTHGIPTTGSCTTRSPIASPSCSYQISGLLTPAIPERWEWQLSGAPLSTPPTTNTRFSART